MKKFLLHQEISNDIRLSRLICTIGPYPFYRSSGYNSGFSETFFPFAGIKQTNGYNQRGWYIKPSNGGRFLDEGYYPRALKVKLFDMATKNSRVNKTTMELVERFGNFEAMILSYHIGGGFWETPLGTELGIFLIANYKSSVKKLYHQYQVDINDIEEQVKSSSAVNVVILTTKDGDLITYPELVNTFLQEELGEDVFAITNRFNAEEPEFKKGFQLIEADKLNDDLPAGEGAISCIDSSKKESPSEKKKGRTHDFFAKKREAHDEDQEKLLMGSQNTRIPKRKHSERDLVNDSSLELEETRKLKH